MCLFKKRFERFFGRRVEWIQLQRFRSSVQRVVRFGVCSVFVLGLGCESESTLDSVMNSSSEFSQDAKSSSGTAAFVEAGEGGAANGNNSNSINSSGSVAPADPPTSAAGDRVGLSASGVGGSLDDVSTGIDHPRISREDFVVRLSIPAREYLLEYTKKPGNSFVLVGKVTPTVDDWQHISFVEFYEPDRQFQFRTNGVKILVPRELVNRLHNATIDLDAESKRLFVTLAR